MRVLVLGATGMLGNAVYRLFSQSDGLEAFGAIRDARSAELLPASVRGNLLLDADVGNFDQVVRVVAACRPQLVVNCVGLVKHLAAVEDPLEAIPINAILPHRLARLCGAAGARFVHLSTDCVFSGRKGMYTEEDLPDATDLYGRSKLLGEVDYPNAITLRTSIIGHELAGARSLIGWFLAQRD